jgi:hypothetical protein
LPKIAHPGFLTFLKNKKEKAIAIKIKTIKKF